MVKVGPRKDLVTSFVYFARAERSGLIKIGVSNNPTKRVSDLQVANGERLTAILVVPGSSHKGRQFHSRFKVCRERGEWFREEGPLYKFLADKHLEWSPPKDPTEVNSVPSLKALNGWVRGFATTQVGKDALLSYGLTELEIFLHGCGAETLSGALATYRGRPGWLIIPTDAREFGTNKAAVSSTIDLLETKHIRILDISNPDDKTYAAIIQRAHTAFNRGRFADPRVAVRRGKWGGDAKGEATTEKRNAVMRDDIVQRFVDESGLSLKRLAYLFGAPFNVSALRRHFKNQK